MQFIRVVNAHATFFTLDPPIEHSHDSNSRGSLGVAFPRCNSTPYPYHPA